jgi:hypothetical protein
MIGGLGRIATRLGRAIHNLGVAEKIYGIVGLLVMANARWRCDDFVRIAATGSATTARGERPAVGHPRTVDRQMAMSLSMPKTRFSLAS